MYQIARDRLCCSNRELLFEVSHRGFFVCVAASFSKLMHAPQFGSRLVVMLVGFLPVGSHTKAAYFFSAWCTEIEVIDAVALSGDIENSPLLPPASVDRHCNRTISIPEL